MECSVLTDESIFFTILFILMNYIKRCTELLVRETDLQFY